MYGNQIRVRVWNIVIQKEAYPNLFYIFYKCIDQVMQKYAFEFISKYFDTIILSDTITCFGFVLFCNNGTHWTRDCL